ncbi:MAG: hypothetical protein ACREDS_15840 [Limisphaerales bacterium]
MARSNELEMHIETTPEKSDGDFWGSWLELGIPPLHFEQNNINEHEIWKNALLVETSAGSLLR